MRGSMKSLAKVTFCLVFLLVSGAHGVQAQQNLTVAVLDFQSQSSPGGSKYTQKAADLMINELSRMGINVVERKKLDALIQEQAFQTSGSVDTQTAVNIGKMLGANVILLGTINRIGVGQNTLRVGDSTITRYNTQADINVRAVNVQTGAIIFSDSEVVSVQAKSASVPDFDMGNKAPSVEGPLKTGIEKLSRKFAAKVKGGTPKKSSKPSIM
jgi:curli biogenesis system outer membrane secretion channel CsgG